MVDVNKIKDLRTHKILEILKAALKLYKNGKDIVNVEDVMENNIRYYNEHTTKEEYAEMMHFLSTHHFFNMKWEDDVKLGYAFGMAKAVYLK